MSNKPHEDEYRFSPDEWLPRHGDFLYRYALSRLHAEDAADDVVQETFLSAFRNRDQYRGSGSERGWLLAILRRKVVDFIRNRARVKGQPAQLGESEPASWLFDESGRLDVGQISFVSDPSTISEHRELWGMLKKCLSELSPNQADAFVLRELEEMNADEICDTLRVTKTNLWVLLHRARLGLARCLRRLCGHTEAAQ